MIVRINDSVTLRCSQCSRESGEYFKTYTQVMLLTRENKWEVFLDRNAGWNRSQQWQHICPECQQKNKEKEDVA